MWFKDVAIDFFLTYKNTSHFLPHMTASCPFRHCSLRKSAALCGGGLVNLATGRGCLPPDRGQYHLIRIVYNTLSRRTHFFLFFFWGRVFTTLSLTWSRPAVRPKPGTAE